MSAKPKHVCRHCCWPLKLVARGDGWMFRWCEGCGRLIRYRKSSRTGQWYCTNARVPEVSRPHPGRLLPPPILNILTRPED